MDPVAVIGDRLAPIGLHKLNQRAALQTRVDSKYLIKHAVLDALVDRLAGDLVILEIDGRRSQTYDTVYFDSADVGCFRDHLQRRRMTYKLRTRVYVGTGLHVFEVKLRDGRGQTVKVKTDHADQPPDRIGTAAESFYRDAVRRQYGFEVERRFVPSLRNRYDRITLAAAHGEERTTLDHGLGFFDPVDTERVGGLRAGLVLVETKSATGCGPVDRALWALGARPRRISKYCIGVAMVRPGLSVNRYLASLTAGFVRDRAVGSPGLLASATRLPSAPPVSGTDLPRAPRAPRPPRAARPPKPARIG